MFTIYKQELLYNYVSDVCVHAHDLKTGELNSYSLA